MIILFILIHDLEISLRYKKCEYLVRIIGIFTCHVGTVISGVDEPPYPGSMVCLGFSVVS